MALAKVQADRVARLVVGTLLATPALLTFGLTLWAPAVHTLALSLQTAPLGRLARFAGLANYGRLAADPAFAPALAHSLLVALVRIVALALPAALAGLCSRFPRVGRGWARRAMGVALAFSAPAALALLWRLAGRQVPALDLTNRALALPSYLGLEAFSFLGLGGALAATALLMATTPRTRRALLFLAGMAAAASGLGSFTLPFAATGGRPSGATLTLPLHAFRTAFLQLRLGQAAAQTSLPLAACAGLGLAFGAVSEWLGLRLVPVLCQHAYGPQSTPGALGRDHHEAEPGALPISANGSRILSALGVLGLALAALYVAPFVLAYLWSMGQAFYPAGHPLARATEELATGLALVNGVLAPLLTTFCVSLPVAYLAALSLSLLRPFGHRGSQALYLWLLAGGFVPPVALGIGLYAAVRAAGLYNTPLAPAIGFAASAPALYLFKLYFDGQAPILAKAQEAGQPTLTAFFQLSFGPSLRVVALAGVVTLLASAQSLLWPLLVLAQRDFLPLSLRLVVLQTRLADEPGALGAGCWLVLTVWGAATLIGWALVEHVALRRFEIVAARFCQRPAPGVE